VARRKVRLDDLLVEKGLAGDLRTARAWIVDRRVVSRGRVVDKPGEQFADDVSVTVRGTTLRYASKGGYKLEHALRIFLVDVSGRVVLDAGSSTGGFTDCLLQSGVAKVYAVDVGYGQLRGRLAADSRVVVMERTNIAELTSDRFDPPIDFATVDLSYLSLRTALPIIAGCFVRPARLVGLIKPLYEGLQQEKLNDPVAMRPVLTALFSDLIVGAVPVHDVCISPILGGHGAVEFLLYADQGREPRLPPDALVDRAMASWERDPPSVVANTRSS
jgi:23S rRNA (cytidine1920-2'-O)/16S rRNA (cytidine1409-2'-O)-methyltransferase